MALATAASRVDSLPVPRAYIAGTGAYLPPRVVTNHDLATMMETSHEWIVERSGIEERRYVDPGEGGAEMAARMQAQQSGANQGRADAATIATQAQMRALQAMQSGAAAGAQSQSAAMNRASALDAFNQANTNRQQGVNQRNAASQTASRIQATQDRMGVLAGATRQYNMNASNAAQDARDRAAQTSALINTAIQVAS